MNKQKRFSFPLWVVLTNYGLAEEKQPREKGKFKETGSRQQILTKDQQFCTHDYGLADSEGENSGAEANKVP